MIKIGDKFGRWELVELLQNKPTSWLARCDCGTVKIVNQNNLIRGKTKSCGCSLIDFNIDKNKKLSKHGLYKHRIYRIWSGMKTRCYNENQPYFDWYGGNGVIVCDEWRTDFMSFYNWSMKNGYANNLTIDREDNGGNYEPGNCRWVTQKVNNNNTRVNRLVRAFGEEKSQSAWIEDPRNIANNSLPGFRYRLEMGASPEDALTLKKGFFKVTGRLRAYL